MIKNYTMQSAYLFKRKRKFIPTEEALRRRTTEEQGRARINNELASGFMPGTSLSVSDKQSGNFDSITQNLSFFREFCNLVVKMANED